MMMMMISFAIIIVIKIVNLLRQGNDDKLFELGWFSMRNKRIYGEKREIVREKSFWEMKKKDSDSLSSSSSWWYSKWSTIFTHHDWLNSRRKKKLSQEILVAHHHHYHPHLSIFNWSPNKPRITCNNNILLQKKRWEFFLFSLNPDLLNPSNISSLTDNISVLWKVHEYHWADFMLSLLLSSNFNNNKKRFNIKWTQLEEH